MFGGFLFWIVDVLMISTILPLKRFLCNRAMQIIALRRLLHEQTNRLILIVPRSAILFAVWGGGNRCDRMFKKK